MKVIGSILNVPAAKAGVENTGDQVIACNPISGFFLTPSKVIAGTKSRHGGTTYPNASL
ncbi:hypothetical protein [Aeromonas salmonicida]|uniref:Uncharacterized protein n=1 Tax=Aeromonas salmonicida subsp. pectinolytica 34mel TaxID=1324960 RepID=A0A2D1QMG7_AERSA|nr:hypothetical protein [Aeromonas salmonicida]ATP11446.1 uncharacterized protein Asalp_43820 [Aeromonas salmonicida subsp. pectinolytica 34mel]